MSIFDPKPINYKDLKQRKQDDDYLYREGQTPQNLSVRLPNGNSVLKARTPAKATKGMALPVFRSSEPEDTRKYLIRHQRKMTN